MKDTIKSKIDINRLFSEGKKGSSRDVLILIAPTPAIHLCSTGRLAFIAGKKIGSSPLRNRSKRVMREVARECGGPWPGKDVVFIARAHTASINHDELLSQCRQALKKLGLL